VTRDLLITVDGPAGAGKTTVSRMLADRLGYKYVDTGALYRGVALEVRRAGLNPKDEAGISRLCTTLSLKFRRKAGGSRLYVNGRDVSDLIRDPKISMLASAVSAKPAVRSFLLDVQRQIGKDKGAVFEGRDMGTVVFPDADVKFYLSASPQVRAYRRFLELQSDRPQTIEEVVRDMNRRDNDDSSRAVAPLKPARDAVFVDSTEISAEQVVAYMLFHVEKFLER